MSHTNNKEVERILKDGWLHYIGERKNVLESDTFIEFVLPYLHQELQKARQDWLREEIVKLENMKVLGLYSEIKNRVLQPIIDRYQSELDQSNK